jgi:hypothetical protein
VEALAVGGFNQIMSNFQQALNWATTNTFIATHLENKNQDTRVQHFSHCWKHRWN